MGLCDKFNTSMKTQHWHLTLNNKDTGCSGFAVFFFPSVSSFSPCCFGSRSQVHRSTDPDTSWKSEVLTVCMETTFGSTQSNKGKITSQKSNKIIKFYNICQKKPQPAKEYRENTWLMLCLHWTQFTWRIRVLCLCLGPRKICYWTLDKNCVHKPNTPARCRKFSASSLHENNESISLGSYGWCYRWVWRLAVPN